MINEKVKYGTPLHNKLLSALLSRRNLSTKAYQKKAKAWKEVDERYRCYVNPSEEERARKAAQDSHTPTYSQIVVPYDYAIVLTAHTYWTSVFFSRDPIFQVTGRNGETQQKVQAQEALLDYQRNVGELTRPLFQWLLDTGKYGVGIISCYWADEAELVSQIVKVEKTFMGMGTGKFKNETVTKRVRSYTGNRIANIRPQNFHPDPRVPISLFQQGAFCGVTSSVGWHSILKDADEYMNLPEARKSKKKIASQEGATYARDMVSEDDDVEPNPYQDMGFFENLEMFVDLSPKEWDLGDTSYPEKWVFQIANDQVIIKARPLGANHCKYPFQVLTYEMESEDLVGRGLFEILRPLCMTNEWLLHSHFFNVRSVLNDNFIVDPSRVTMKDFESGPGRLIRLNAAAAGTDPATAIKQLPVIDITSQNLQNMGFIQELIQRVSGVTDNLMGLQTAGGRKTATEVRTAASNGVNRQKTFTEWASSTGFAPLIQMLIQNGQQWYEEEMQVRIAGSLLSWNGQYIKVSPEDIAGFYDFVPVDGSLPIDRMGQVQMWKEILLMLTKAPQLGQTYDLAAIFGWMAQLAGLRNINQFKVAAPAALDQQVAAGNLVPSDKIPGVDTSVAAPPSIASGE